MSDVEIRVLATKIRDFLDEYWIAGDCRIYFNGMCWEHSIGDEGWKRIDDIDPKDYFEYAGGIISMSFEGILYDIFNGYTNLVGQELAKKFGQLLRRYSCYYELGNSWNLSIHEIRSDDNDAKN